MFEKTIDYARDSLITASEAAVGRAGDRLGEVLDNASQAIDEKLDKISNELHNQRSLTKDDVRELVDYAGDRLSLVLDERITRMRREITELVQERTEYFKAEIDAFFIQRQQDLARERRRLIINIVLAAGAALAVGTISLFYKGLRDWDMLNVFRVVLAALAGGWGVWLSINLLRRWLRMSEHRKDLFYLTARYWGWLQPSNVFSILLMLAVLIVLILALAFPHEAMQLIAQPILPPDG